MQFPFPFHSYTDKYPTKLLALYHAVRDTIVRELIPYQAKLPSSRELASIYGMSRGTVNQVYDMLAAEGYVTSHVGRGTFVSFQVMEQRPRESARSEAYPLSAWSKWLEKQHGRPLHMMTPTEAAPRIVDFHASVPDPEWFPKEEWSRCLYAQVRALSTSDPNHTAVSTLGDAELRDGIARYLRRTRGMTVEPGQVAVVNGSMQAIALLAQLLITPGDPVIVESPGYSGAYRAFEAAGGRCVPVPVDESGIVPADWDSKVLFVTPNRQFPTGVVLPMERRRQLLSWASARNALIIEDNYDSEFRHRGKMLEPLKALDQEERVIYIGSFTKTLLPSVRLGYAVLPTPLIGLFAKAKAIFEPHPTGLLEQKTMAAWMQSGQYERHLRRMRRIYGRKFYKLHELLTTLLSPYFKWVEGDAGLDIFGWWKGSPEQYVQFRSRCYEAGIRWSETADSEAEGFAVRYGAYFNFPHLSEEDMGWGVQRMRELADELERERA